jgi:hypothetical protein
VRDPRRRFCRAFVADRREESADTQGPTWKWCSAKESDPRACEDPARRARLPETHVQRIDARASTADLRARSVSDRWRAQWRKSGPRRSPLQQAGQGNGPKQRAPTSSLFFFFHFFPFNFQFKLQLNFKFKLRGKVVPKLLFNLFIPKCGVVIQL